MESVHASLAALSALTGLPALHSVGLIAGTLVALFLVTRVLFGAKNRVVPTKFDLVQKPFEHGVVDAKVDEYLDRFAQDKELTKDDGTPEAVGEFYALVTDFYEYGWGQSFHFAHWKKGEKFQDAILRQERRIVKNLELKPGMRVLDVGCGVGGPLRNIARMSGADVTGECRGGQARVFCVCVWVGNALVRFFRAQIFEGFEQE